MGTPSRTTDLKVIAILLAVMALISLCYDIWELVSGHVDVNEHLPFLLPIAFMGFAGIVWRMKKHADATPATEDQE